MGKDNAKIDYNLDNILDSDSDLDNILKMSDRECEAFIDDNIYPDEELFSFVYWSDEPEEEPPFEPEYE